MLIDKRFLLKSLICFINFNKIDNLRFSIKDIAEKVGFSNDTTFRRQFKKYIGVAPAEYRNITNID